MCQFYDVNSKLLEKYCRNFEGQLPGNCFKNIIHLNRTDVTHLKIGGCDNETVLDAIETFENVRALDISHSGYEHLDWLTGVQALERLEMFNASHNRLEWVSPLLMKSAQVVDLSHNQISALVTNIRSNTFEGADKLRRVHLSNNLISTIEGDIFIDSPNLECINLRSNKLNAIPSFPVNKNLKAIHLEGNSILSFSCSAIPMHSSISLYIPWNYLYTIFSTIVTKNKCT